MVDHLIKKPRQQKYLDIVDDLLIWIPIQGYCVSKKSYQFFCHINKDGQDFLDIQYTDLGLTMFGLLLQPQGQEKKP